MTFIPRKICFSHRVALFAPTLLFGLLLLPVLPVQAQRVAQGGPSQQKDLSGPAQAPLEKQAEALRSKSAYRRFFKELETMFGRPLTDSQKKQIMTALETRRKQEVATRDRYMADVAKTMGISEADLRERVKQLHEQQESARQQAKQPLGRSSTPGTRSSTQTMPEM